MIKVLSEHFEFGAHYFDPKPPKQDKKAKLEKLDPLNLSFLGSFGEIQREASMPLSAEFLEGFRLGFTKGLKHKFPHSHSVSSDIIKVITEHYEFGANYLGLKGMDYMKNTAFLHTPNAAQPRAIGLTGAPQKPTKQDKKAKLEKVDLLNLPYLDSFKEILQETSMPLNAKFFEGFRFNFTKGLDHSVFMGSTEHPSHSSDIIKVITGQQEIRANSLDLKGKDNGIQFQLGNTDSYHTAGAAQSPTTGLASEPKNPRKQDEKAKPENVSRLNLLCPSEEIQREVSMSSSAEFLKGFRSGFKQGLNHKFSLRHSVSSGTIKDPTEHYERGAKYLDPKVGSAV